MGKEITVVDLNTMEPLRVQTRLRYNAITKAKDGSKNMSFHLVLPDAGRSGTAKYDVDEIVYILEGKLTIGWGGKKVDLLPNMLAYIPAGQEFEYKYGEKTKVIGIYSPARE